ncbi:MAG: lysophospholipase [Rubripirellula sp.]
MIESQAPTKYLMRMPHPNSSSQSPSEIVCTEQLCRFDSGERFVRSWRPQDTAVSSDHISTVLAVVHGLGDHSGRFDEMARWFAERGVHVYALDLLGHGNSPGDRMVIPSYEALLHDVENFVDYVQRRHEHSPLGLFGQSMGGNLVLNHQLRGYSRTAYVIAGSPMLRSANQPGAISMFFLRMLSQVCPNIKINGNVNSSELSRDPEMQQAFQEDPLVQHGITLKLGRVLIDSGEWALQSAHQIPTTALLTHGSEDRITCHQASIEFAERSQGMATTKIWPGGKHDLHHDTARDEYFASMLAWIREIDVV